MPLALIAFDFDPILRLGDLVVRWETLALAITIVVSVSLAAVIAGRMPAVNEAYPEMGGREVVIDAEYVRQRLDDVLKDQDLSRYIL